MPLGRGQQSRKRPRFPHTQGISQLHASEHSPISAIRGDGAFFFRQERPSPTAGLPPRRNALTNGRAEVRPNLNARGDCTRPCYAGRRSVKREPKRNGKTKRIPGRVFPMRTRISLSSPLVHPPPSSLPHAHKDIALMFGMTPAYLQSSPCAQGYRRSA